MVSAVPWKQLDSFIPESRIHSQLLNFQQRLASQVQRNTVNTNYSKPTTQVVKKILRLYILNSTEHQPKEPDSEDSEKNAPEPTASEEEVPRWVLRVRRATAP